MIHSIQNVKLYIITGIFLVFLIPLHGFTQGTDSVLPKNAVEKKTITIPDFPKRSTEKKLKSPEKKRKELKRSDNTGTARPVESRIVENKNEKVQLNTIEKVSDGLLEINDGSFIYKRIPEIRIEEKRMQSSEDLSGDSSEKVVADEKEKNVDGIEKKGLFGLSKQSTDVMAKIVLILIILVIFVLYKTRSREGQSNVLRRFPKG